MQLLIGTGPIQSCTIFATPLLCRVDRGIGYHVWNSSQVCDIVPMPPQLSFHMPLIPIEHWFNMESHQKNYPTTMPFAVKNLFSSIVLLLRHCKENHSSNLGEYSVNACNYENANAQAGTEHSNAEQASANKLYWNKYNVCLECGTEFNRA